MCDHRNDGFQKKPVRDFSDLLQHSKTGANGHGTPAREAFENWWLEYRNRLAKVLRGETSNTSKALRARNKSAN
jgi:hypothetical protein